MPRKGSDQYRDIKLTVYGIDKLHRCIAHIVNYELPHIRTLIAANSNETLRVQYIIKEINKDKLADEVYKYDNRRRKNTEMLHIFELVSAYGIDMFREFSTLAADADSRSTARANPDTLKTYQKTILKKVEEFHQLRLYCNEQLAIISASYGCQMPVINEQFEIKKEKAYMSVLTNKGKGKAKMPEKRITSSSFASGSK